MVEEIFEFRCPEIPQNKELKLLYSQNIFTMVVENFEFQCSEMPQNKEFQKVMYIDINI